MYRKYKLNILQSELQIIFQYLNPPHFLFNQRSSLSFCTCFFALTHFVESVQKGHDIVVALDEIKDWIGAKNLTSYLVVNVGLTVKET